jgi:hypothetical protein
MPVSLNTFNVTSLATLDKRGGLYKTNVPFDENSGATAQEALVYSDTKLSNNRPAPAGAVYLQSSPENYFSIDRTEKTLTMVASTGATSLNLYVYTNKPTGLDSGYVEKYSFDADGVLTSSTELTTALEIAAEELNVAHLDIDNNKAVGGKLEDKAGILDKLGNLYKVKVAQQDVFIVTDGEEISKSTTSIDLEEFALKVEDGVIWAPDPLENYSSFTAVESSDVRGGGTGWDVFAVKKDVAGATTSITKFSFDSDRVLMNDGEKILSAKELASLELESSLGRDLDGNKLFGIASTEAVDATGGLYKASLLGSDFYVVNTSAAGLKPSKTLATGVDFSGALLNEEQAAWTEPTDYEITSIVTDEVNDTAQVYVTNIDDPDKVLRFDFNLDDGNYSIDEDALDGTELDSFSLAAAESLNTRDLNNDNEFGITPGAVLDKKGGLNIVSALGQQFLVTGTSIVTNKNKVTDLTNALTLSSGDAWWPEDSDGEPVALTATSNNIKVIVSANQRSADVYVKSDGAFTKYEFARANTTQTWALSANEPTTLDDIELAALETSTGRDISGEGLFGAYVDARLDKAPGLYTAHFGSVGDDPLTAVVTDKVYLYSAEKITPGSVITNRVDFSKALMDEEGASFWTPTDGYEITGAYFNADDEEYTVFVTLKTDPTHFDSTQFRAYTFDLSEGSTQYQLKDLDYSITGPELVTLENLVNRDLNEDDIKGIDVYKDIQTSKNETDKVGGLFKVKGPDGDYFVSKPSTSTGRITDLTNAFYSDEDKTAAWNLNSSSTDTIAYATTKLTLKQNADDTFTIYQQEKPTALLSQEANVYTKYSFDANHVLIADPERLNLIELANEESPAVVPGVQRITRDINGDGFIGAKVEAVIDRFTDTASSNSFLSKVSIEGKYMLSATSTAPGRVTNLMNVLLKDDSTPLLINEQGEILDDENAGTGYFAKSVIRRTVGSNTIVELYANGVNNNGTGSDLTDDFTDVKMIQFEQTNKNDSDSDLYFRVSEPEVILDSEKLIELETRAVIGRDLNRDKVVGVKISENIDKTSGLYSTTVLGEKYYFHEAVNTRSGTNLTTSVDLSTAFFTEESMPWAPPEDDTIAGMVVNSDEDDEVTGYDIYTYKQNSENESSLTAGQKQYDVTKYSWSYSAADKLVYQGPQAVDTASLVAVETSVRKDLSGDRFVGFNILPTAGRYTGVTQAKVLGGSDGRFYVVTPKNPTVGTPTNPWSAANALLNEDGDGAWSVPAITDDFAGYSAGSITAVREPSVNPDNNRFVYVKYTKSGADDLVYKYKFSTEDGKYSGESELLDSVNLANEEFALNLDLNADDKKGIVRYDDIRAGAVFNSAGTATGGTKSMGLMRAEMNNTAYLVAKNIPATSKKISLDMALLNSDGTAWKPDEDFTIKGIYRTGVDDKTEIYGTVTVDGVQQFRKYVFEQEEYVQSADAFEAYEDPTLVLKLVPAGSASFTNVTNSYVAEREITAEKDLNNDNRVGFVVKTGASDLKASTLVNSGTTIGKASAGGDSEIYVALKGASGRRDFGNLGIMTQSAFNAAKTANQNALRDADEYWKPDDGFEVLSILEDGVDIKVFAGLKSGPLPDDLADDFDKNTLYEYTFSQGETGWDLEGTKAVLDTEGVIAREVGLTKARDLNDDGSFGLTFDQKISTSGLIKGYIGSGASRKDYIFVGNNISKAESLGTTSSKAFGLDSAALSLLKADSEDTPWSPASGLTPKNFATVLASALPTNILESDVDFVMTLTNASNQESKLYFDSDYQLYAPYPLLDAGAERIAASYSVSEDLEGYVPIPFDFAKTATGAVSPENISIWYVNPVSTETEEAPAWMTFDDEENSIAVSATNGNVGTYTVFIRASDADDRYVEKSFTLNVLNADDKPQLVTGQDAKIGDEEIDPTEVFVTIGRNFPLINVSDVFETVDAGDTLTYSIAVKNTNDTDADTPSWLSINSSTGVFAANSIDVLATDLKIEVTATASANATNGLVLSEKYSFIIKPNTAPSKDVDNFSNVAMATVGNAFEYDFTDLFDDTDAGDELTFTVKLANGDALPTGWTVDGTKLTSTSVPSAMTNTMNVKITAIDSHDVETDFALAISKNIKPSKLSSIVPQTFTVRTPWDSLPTMLEGIFTDRDSADTLTFKIVNTDDSELTGGLSFDSDSKILSYDGSAGISTGILNLTVKAYDHYDANDVADSPNRLSVGTTNLKLTINPAV